VRKHPSVLLFALTAILGVSTSLPQPYAVIFGIIVTIFSLIALVVATREAIREDKATAEEIRRSKPAVRVSTVGELEDWYTNSAQGHKQVEKQLEKEQNGQE